MSVVTSAERADILLITVNKNETKAVSQAAEAVTKTAPRPVTISDRVYHDLGIVNEMRVFHALSEMGAGGPGAAQQSVDKAIRALHPHAVIAVGVAFGVNSKKQSIGNILVSRQLRLYELQRAGNQIILRGDKPHASSRLINFFETFSQVSWTGQKVEFDVLLTGEKLIDNVNYRDQLLKFEPEAVGGEMEGAGIYTSCNDHKVDWIIIKAICDWADGNKQTNKKRRQQKAAQAAADFVFKALLSARLISTNVGGGESTRIVGASASQFQSFEELSRAICKLLRENHAIFRTFGPRSEAAVNDPATNLHSHWEQRRRDTIVPNNRQILALLAANYALLPAAILVAVEDFKVHARAYEHHVTEPLDNYPTFPASFSTAMGCQ